MEDGDGEDRPPFWLQNATHLRRGDRLRRRVSAVLFSSGLVVLLLLVTAVFFLVFVVPSTLSFSVHIFRPNSVKKSWDSLNVFLVIVAVVFGFLSRNKNEERDTYFDGFQSSPIKENGSSQKSFNSVGPKYESEQKNLILKRNSSSYPDLREFSSVNWSYGDYQARFYDDINVDSGRVSDPDLLHHHRRHRSLEQVDYLRERPENRNVVVDTLVREFREASNPPPSPPHTAAPEEAPAEDEEIPNNAVARKERSSRKVNRDLEALNSVAAPKPQLPPVGDSPALEFQENQKRGNERVVRRKERSNRKKVKDVEAMDTVTAPPPPPPPPPPKEKISKSDRKRGGATGSSTKDFLNSLYHKKKKKQRQKSVDNMESLLHEAEAPLSVQIPPPPPPPSVFQNLFSSKKQKRKRTITVKLEPHPPPRAEAGVPEPTSRTPAVTAGKPPQPIKMNRFDKLDEASNSGGESPLNRIPPPPPPPPPAFFRSPAWKFVVQGDYVRINSNNSSRSGSPDPDETESDVTPSAAYGGDAVAFHPSPLFCASPDVNTKAESFITNFRAKLKLEKIHSMKKREPGLSSLGPGPGPSQI